MLNISLSFLSLLAKYLTAFTSSLIMLHFKFHFRWTLNTGNVSSQYSPVRKDPLLVFTSILWLAPSRQMYTRKGVCFIHLCCVRLSCQHPALIQYRVEDCCCAPHFSLERGMWIHREPCSQCHLPYPCSKLAWLKKRGYFSLSNMSVRIQGSACCLGEAFSLLLKVLNPTLLLTGWRKHHPPTVWVSKLI